jgi:hypothetical protein
MSLNPRDYRERSAVLSADFANMLDNHPDAFDCLLYKAIRSTPENLVLGLVDDVVGAAEGSERKIEYADPVQTRGMLVPEEQFLFAAYTDGAIDENVGSAEQPLVLLLKEAEVPKQSVVTWVEFTGQGAATKEVRVYILESKAFGKAPSAGLKHYCIPMIDEGEIG